VRACTLPAGHLATKDTRTAEHLGRSGLNAKSKNNFRRAEELTRKAITLGRLSGVGHNRDRAAYRHDGTTELILLRSRPSAPSSLQPFSTLDDIGR